ncbi:MAG: diguanylate cyclase, partial [Actinomycetota bacterium]|nr:diguanylate cyclase [Actinomycetota bacterium]
MALDLDEFPTDLWGMPGSAGTARHLADPTLRGLRRPWVGWLRRCLVLVLVLYSATTIPGVRSGGYNALIDGWVQNGVLVGACLLVFVRVSLERSCRLAWASIGTGVGLYAIGNIIYFAYVQYLDAVSYPSVADLPWLGSYLFLYLGLVGLARRRVQASEGTLWLDGLVSTLGIGAVASIGLNVVLHSTPGSVAAVVTTMAYPVGDLLLLMLIVATSGLLGWRPDRAWTLLGVGVVLFASADTIYVLRVATGSYQAGTLLDPLWA